MADSLDSGQNVTCFVSYTDKKTDGDTQHVDRNPDKQILTYQTYMVYMTWGGGLGVCEDGQVGQEGMETLAREWGH